MQKWNRTGRTDQSDRTDQPGGMAPWDRTGQSDRMNPLGDPLGSQAPSESAGQQLKKSTASGNKCQSALHSSGRGFAVRRMVFDAMLVALFVVLSFLNVRIGNVFKIGLSSFATIMAAILLGPVDGFLVGCIGEFLEQLLTYGLTPTTVLYLIGPGARGLVLGLVLLLFAHGTSAYITALDRKRPYALGTALILSSFAQTMLNTLANYVDSKLFGWYSPEIVFGSLAARTIVGFAQTFVFAGLAVTVLHALRNSRFIPYPAAVNR